jgi:adenylate cyclase
VGLLAEQDEPLGPVRRETVAVLFADIVGFTRMAERMAPDAVVSMLREFHEHMAAEIFACGGTIDKYIGDAILAVFGLPTSGREDAAHALCCAGRMLQALERWNAQRRARGEPALAIGIGINYGPAVLGDVGSDQGLSFTVIGDTVNTAHRLQVLTAFSFTAASSPGSPRRRPRVPLPALVVADNADITSRGRSPLSHLDKVE